MASERPDWLVMTRAEYVQGGNLRTYYGQFVSPPIKEAVRDQIGIEALMASDDPENFSDIRLGKWDLISFWEGSLRESLRVAGDFWSLATRACVLKEAARQIVEEEREKASQHEDAIKVMDSAIAEARRLQDLAEPTVADLAERLRRAKMVLSEREARLGALVRSREALLGGLSKN